jgi:hypothetical protein
MWPADTVPCVLATAGRVTTPQARGVLHVVCRHSALCSSYSWLCYDSAGQGCFYVDEASAIQDWLRTCRTYMTVYLVISLQKAPRV